MKLPWYHIRNLLWIIPLTLAICLQAGYAAAGEPAQMIEWYLSDMAPAQIRTGELAGKGYGDKTNWRLIAAMPEYQHRIVVANVKRKMTDLKQKPNACACGMIRTPERAEYALFSESVGLALANSVVVPRRKERLIAPALDADGAVDLDKVLSAGLSLAVRSGRAYGDFLDGFVSKARERRQLLVMPEALKTGESTLGMLNAGRADFSLLFPIELEFAMRNEKFDGRFTSYPVAGASPFTVYGVACAKSPIGEKIIAAINPVIQKNRDNYYAFIYRSWLPPSSVALYEKLHQETFNQAIQPVKDLDEIEKVVGAIADCLQAGAVWHQGQCDRSQVPPPVPENEKPLSSTSDKSSLINVSALVP